VFAGADPLVGTVLGGSYTLLSRLGGGGMGVVYRARQNRLQRDVALKVLSLQLSADDRARERFRTEALAVSQLSNPHTVAIHDFGSTDQGLLYLVMALLEGESLRNRLRQGPLGIRAAVNIAAQVAESLAEAHARKPQIIHRDIKPDNIVVRTEHDGEDFVTVLDFGLAKLANASSDKLTASGLIVGTPAYMAPEQARGDEKVDARVDLYALGVLLHEMISGRQPFVAENPTALLYKQVWDPPPTLSECCPGRTIPPELEQIVLSLLAKNPEERPATAAIVRARLLEIFRKRSGELTSIPPPTPTAVTPVAQTLIESAPDLGSSKPPGRPPGDSLFESPPQSTLAQAASAARTTPGANGRTFDSEIAAGVPTQAKKRWLLPVGLTLAVLTALGGWFALTHGFTGANTSPQRFPAPIATPSPAAPEPPPFATPIPVPPPAPLPAAAAAPVAAQSAPATTPSVPAAPVEKPEPAPALLRPPSISRPAPIEAETPSQTKTTTHPRRKASSPAPAGKEEGDFPEVPE
jgi:serine/threonine protein kinase